MSLIFTKHPMLPSLTDAEIVKLWDKDPDLLKRLHKQHEDRIQASVEDPLRYGFNLSGWSRIQDALETSDEALVLGGNRSGKTTGCAKAVMRAVQESMDGHIVCFSQNEDTSIKVQQAAVWEMMPKEFKKKTKSIEGYINYSMQNGFTAKSFIFPDTRTRVDFKTYTQFSNNQTILEGMEFGFKDPKGINIGTWLDEYLGDATLVNTLRFRLATRNSKMLIGFTPIDGFTPFVSEYLAGAEIEETRYAELLDRDLPVVQKCSDRDAKIVYLHSDENPFGGYSRIAKDLASQTEEEIMVRAYGIPVKSMTSLIPLFSTSVNVLGDEENSHGMKFPDITSKKDFTCYQVLDPAGARNFVSIWAAVNEKGEVYVMKEWPDRYSYGEWALFGQPRWKYGPAAKKLGFDIAAYVELFKEIEEDLGIEVYERIGDSRYFARENENNEDLFTVFSDNGMDFIPSSGVMEETGIAALDEWFAYNPNAKIDEANKPMCYLHENCENTLDSLINYNSSGKNDEALKDFFDVMRYLRMINSGDGPDHYNPSIISALDTKNKGY